MAGLSLIFMIVSVSCRMIAEFIRYDDAHRGRTAFERVRQVRPESRKRGSGRFRPMRL